MRHALPWLVVLTTLAGCSTLAPEPPEVECISNEDCDQDPGFVCDLGVCRDGGDKPPLALIGFDLREVAGGQAQFRAEVAGCDREVLSEGTTIPVLSLPRRELAQTLSLGVVGADSTNSNESPLPSTFTLSQGSRFAREAHRRQVTFDPLPEELLEDALVQVAWPRYLVDNALPPFLEQGGYLVWETQPLPVEDSPPAALRYQQLAPPVSYTGELRSPCRGDLDCCVNEDSCDPEDVRNACVLSPGESGECRAPFNDQVEYTYVYADVCDRPIRGQVVTVDDQLSVLGRLPGPSVALRHADPQRGPPLGLPRLDVTQVDMRESECTSTAACAAGLICNTETEQCELPLAGLLAWTGTVPMDPEPGLEGQFDARVYTYCDGLPTSEPLQRSFDITVTPPESGLPTVVLHADVDFGPLQAGGQKPIASFGGDLCVPAVGATQVITLALSGEPRTLLDGYTCCDIDCLPRTEDDVDGPPEPRAQCAGASAGTTPTFRAESPLEFDAERLEAWNADDSPCISLRPDEEGTVGILRRSGACGTPDDTNTTTPQCDLSLPDNGGALRTYDLRIETPTGSVLGSLDTTLDVDASSGATVTEIMLPSRVMVHGRAVVEDCVEADGDCGSPGAKILAERLRMDEESEAKNAGPYFHQVSTFFDPTKPPGQQAGAYVLLLDPGVWVVTALPDSGTDGGPAPISVLDLRATDSKEHDFQLETGILVTVDVSSFDRRSEMIPLDTGSYADLSNPDTEAPLDLGAAGQCLSSEGAAVGCRIRRLVGGASLPPSQIGQVRFTARNLDTNAAADCTRPP
ncbi:MAG: hypothetical protein KUG77_12725 [Nannocystaceae bacterium]|nr:hypothetical protein [Nannocystaceae bacterium]